MPHQPYNLLITIYLPDRRRTCQYPRTSFWLTPSASSGRMPSMSDNRKVASSHHWLIAGIFFLALALRIAFLLAMRSEVDSTRWPYLTPDTAHYIEAAAAIHDSGSFSSLGVQTFGPGYPLFLALLRLLTAHSPIVMMLAQIFLSAFISVLFAWWALQLTHDCRTAWITGLLNAFSFTAISLANIFLSETLFVALIVGGALLLLSAMKRSHYVLAVTAGLLFGLATLTRSMGVGLPAVMLALALLGGRARLFPRLKIGAVSVLAAVVVMIFWSTAFSPDSARVTGAVPSAMARIVRAVEASDSGTSRKQATAKLAIDCLKHANDSTGDFYSSERFLITRRFQHLLADRPGVVVMTIVTNIRDNIGNEFGTLSVQIPSFASTYETIRIVSAKKGLNYRVLLLSILGALILLRRKEYQLCFALSLIFTYFALVSGFSDSQTSRIFYPAQMAWGILVSVVLLAMYDWGKKRWSGRGQRLTS